MSASVTERDPTLDQQGGPPRKGGAWRQLAKHQAASLIATVVDFGTMIALVELGWLRPALATVVGATCGATSNFWLGRHWTFDATAGRARGQALRYALVSATSLGLNALGEHVLAERWKVQYVLARLGVALAVSVLWNFPLQRFFVFAARPESGSPPRGI